MRVYRRGRGFGDFLYGLEFGLNPLLESATFQILVAQSLVQQRDLVCYIFVVASRNIRLLKVHRSALRYTYSLRYLLLKVLKYSFSYIFVVASRNIHLLKVHRSSLRCLLIKVLKYSLRYLSTA